MTSKEAYQHLLDRVFGPGVVTADAPDAADNPITGALRLFDVGGQFQFFAEQLEARLRRLNAAFREDPCRREVLGKIARLASERNFSGTFAELAAYDFFSILTPVLVERMVPVEQTLASELPDRRGSSFDGELPEFNNLYFDVKSFSDVATEIIKSICRRALPLQGIAHITADYPYDTAHAPIGDNFRALVAGLREAGAARQSVYQHPEIPQVRFRLIPAPSPAMLTTEHRYRPEVLLDEMRHFVLSHWDQILRDRPNLRVYVVHPWFNFVQSDFTQQAEFYAQYCHRAFTQLAAEMRPLNQLVPNLARGAELPVAEVVRRIGAILFLEDRTVEPPDGFRQPTDVFRGHLFINPNAHPPNTDPVTWRQIGTRAADRAVHLDVRNA